MSKKSSLIALYEAESNLIDINHEEIDKINKIVTAPTKKPPPDSFKQELKQLSDMKRTFGKKTYPNDNYSDIYKEQYMPYFRQTHLTWLPRWTKDVKYI